MTSLATVMQLEMRALAERRSPMHIFADSEFMYWWTKERARADAIDAAKARLPIWVSWRRLKREGNRAFKKTRPDWKAVREPLPNIDRAQLSWWKNRAA